MAEEKLLKRCVPQIKILIGLQKEKYKHLHKKISQCQSIEERKDARHKALTYRHKIMRNEKLLLELKLTTKSL